MKYPAYPAYKDSGVEWIGIVPEHWGVWKISHAYKNIGSGTTPPTTETMWYEGEIPWVTTGELREKIILDTAKHISESAIAELSALKIHPAGSLVIAMYGATIGRLGILGVPATTNQACCVLYNSKCYNFKYTYYCFCGFKDEIVVLSSGGGQPNISLEKISSLKFTSPSMVEQEAIVGFLDRKTSLIDDLIAKKEQQIELMKEKRTAVINRAVSLTRLVKYLTGSTQSL